MVKRYKYAVIKITNGYSHIATPTGEYEDAVEFSPWDGSELPNAMLWELQHELFDIWQKNESGLLREDSIFFCELNELKKIHGLLTNYFDPDSIPSKLKFLLSERGWFDMRVLKARDQHVPKQNEFCGGFSAFLDSCYGMETLPLITQTAISFCPYCGATLPHEFHTDEWWRKRGS
jgi:hypothetical protein